MWMSDTERTMWICLRGASLMAFQTASMSLGTARARAVITGAPSRLPTSRAMRWQAVKSPGLLIGKPASITSTPSRAS